MDITELNLNDHHEQRRMFALLDEAGGDPARLGPLWDRLSKTGFSAVHARGCPAA